MAMAMTLREYLDDRDVDYEVLSHPYTLTASETARVMHVPGDQVAKSVLLEDEDGYLMAVVPATHRLQIGRLHKQLHRNLGLATEHELDLLFDDCESGAIPPVGQAYGIDVVVDDAMAESPDVYFDAGDHTGVIHMSGRDFERLMAGMVHGHFSRHV